MEGMRLTKLVARAICCFAAGVLVGCGAADEPDQAPVLDRAADEVALRAQTQLYADGVNARDGTAVANLYAPDGDLIFFDEPLREGRDAIRNGLDSAAFSPTFRVQLTVTGIRFVAADVGIVETVATLNEGEPRENRGTAVFVRENGKWAISALRVFPAQRK
jgi:uncharacterized protein (TIGR02246 family)